MEDEYGQQLLLAAESASASASASAAAAAAPVFAAAVDWKGSKHTWQSSEEEDEEEEEELEEELDDLLRWSLGSDGDRPLFLLLGGMTGKANE